MFSTAGTHRQTIAAVARLFLLCLLPAQIRLPTSRVAACQRAAALIARDSAGGSGDLRRTAVESLWRRAERAPPVGMPA